MSCVPLYVSVETCTWDMQHEWGYEKYIQILVRTKSSLGRCRWEDIIKTDLTERVFENVD
jgi:hypothetical protein